MSTIGTSRVSRLASSLISVAVVVAGGVARADVTDFAAGNRLSAGMFGNFSANDLEKLEHASTAGATTARLAAMGVKTAAVADTARASAASLAYEAPTDNDDLFPHSARLLPLMVAAPQPAATIGRGTIAPRPGVAQPVGVSRSALRSRTPAERAAR